MKENCFCSLMVLLLLMSSFGYGDDYTGDKSCGKSYRDRGVDYVVFCDGDGFLVKKPSNGLLARINGHTRGFVGETMYGANGSDVNMLGHRVDVSCCEGFGVLINGFAGGAYTAGGQDIIVRNGYFQGKTGTFVIGSLFLETYSTDGGCLPSNWAPSKNIKLEKMWVSGDYGSISSNFSGIIESRISLMSTLVRGESFSFADNYYLVAAESSLISFPNGTVQKESPLRNRLVGDVEPIRSPGIPDYRSALYLSCADNATISNNIFTAKTKTPGAYAIVLKHSKNVRIIRNTFEGFDVPVLMDKYSSIIDDTGNIIKPNVTVSDPESKLYGLDLEKPFRSIHRPWWQFWR